MRVTLLVTLVMYAHPQERIHGQGTPKNPADNVTRLTKRQAWALGASAVLIEHNHGRHDFLGTQPATQDNVEEMRKFLGSGDWSINSKSDLFARLDKIDDGGLRFNFESLGRLVSSMNEEDYQKNLKQYEGYPEQIKKIKIARKYYAKLGKKSIIGFDYARYINLCRWSYLAGYISEEKAWEIIMPAARILQRTFDSWEDLGRNYLIGREFCPLKESERERAPFFEDAFQRLLDMKSSPWNEYPWNLDLGGLKKPKEDKKPDAKKKLV